MRFILVLSFALIGVGASTEKLEQKKVTVCEKGKCEIRQLVPMVKRTRNLVDPETMGVEKDCPFPVSKEELCFQCPRCGLKMWTNLVYHHLPWCPKKGCNNCPMPEVIEK
jgi:hypothetical protein